MRPHPCTNTPGAYTIETSHTAIHALSRQPGAPAILRDARRTARALGLQRWTLVVCDGSPMAGRWTPP